jgi:hypothetical protein
MTRAIIVAGVILAAALAAPGLAAAQAAPEAANGADAANGPKAPDRGPRVDDLMASGFVVVKDTKVVGDFDGCDYGREVPLASGGAFTCSGFGYMHARNPKVVVLKSSDGRQYKLVVGNAVFDGTYS